MPTENKYHIVVVSEEERDKNTENQKLRVRSGFQLSLTITRKETGSIHPDWKPQGETTDLEDNQGGGIVKGWENKRNRGRIPDTLI